MFRLAFKSALRKKPQCLHLLSILNTFVKNYFEKGGRTIPPPAKAGGLFVPIFMTWIEFVHKDVETRRYLAWCQHIEGITIDRLEKVKDADTQRYLAQYQQI